MRLDFGVDDVALDVGADAVMRLDVGAEDVCLQRSLRGITQICASAGCAHGLRSPSRAEGLLGV